jgi:hypothetical protein
MERTQHQKNNICPVDKSVVEDTSMSHTLALRGAW